MTNRITIQVGNGEWLALDPTQVLFRYRPDGDKPQVEIYTYTDHRVPLAVVFGLQAKALQAWIASNSASLIPANYLRNSKR